MVLKGRTWKFGDSISTDLICPGRYFHLRSNLPELAKHVLEDADPQFASKMAQGDFVVAGNNFGLGSSREHAPTIIKLAGVAAVLAKSFARIFYRNAINNGFYLIESTDAPEKINDGDELQIDFKAGLITNKTAGIDINFNPLPDFALEIINDGGLLEHIKKATTD